MYVNSKQSGERSSEFALRNRIVICSLHNIHMLDLNRLFVTVVIWSTKCFKCHKYFYKGLPLKDLFPVSFEKVFHFQMISVTACYLRHECSRIYKLQITSYFFSGNYSLKSVWFLFVFFFFLYFELCVMSTL